MKNALAIRTSRKATRHHKRGRAIKAAEQDEISVRARGVHLRERFKLPKTFFVDMDARDPLRAARPADKIERALHFIVERASEEMVAEPSLLNHIEDPIRPDEGDPLIAEPDKEPLSC